MYIETPPPCTRPSHVQKVNNILRSFKRLKANAAEGGKPYKEDSVEYKDTIDGLNIVVRFQRGSAVKCLYSGISCEPQDAHIRYMT